MQAEIVDVSKYIQTVCRNTLIIWEVGLWVAENLTYFQKVH